LPVVATPTSKENYDLTLEFRASKRIAACGLGGKKIKISRTIELYKGKPEIKIMSKGQLAFGVTFLAISA
jgi:hypothetical protein